MTSQPTAPSALPERAVRELAAATAALVREHDVIGTTINLLAGCAECVQAAAAGIVLVQPGRKGLEFLAATNHRAQHLEVYQLQVDNGPGVDCVATGQPLTVVGIEAIAGRWPSLLEVFRAAGFNGVHAAPMIWQGSPLGAVNLFYAEGGPTADAELIVQAFADIAALVIAQTTSLSPDELAVRTRAALEERTVVERAKGVLAYTEGLSMDAAFERLVAQARDRAVPLTTVATAVVDDAVAGDRRQP